MMLSPTLQNNGTVMSISQSQQSLVAGQGPLNYLSTATYPTLITDGDIGTVIQDPWYAIVDVGTSIIQVTEYMYANEYANE